MAHVPSTSGCPRRHRRGCEALLFLSPWILGFIFFTGGPTLFALILSFCRWDGLHSADFVGLSNYRYMLHDRMLLRSLTNTLAYAILFIPCGVGMALLLALLLNQNLRGMRLFRTIFYLPTLTHGVATFAIWAVIFDPDVGLLNRLLRPVASLLGTTPPAWLVDPNWSKPALAIMAVWGVGGMMLVFLAGLQNIPVQLYEAARIDGASRFQQFWNVTIPMLSPTLFFNIIVATISSIQVFSEAFVLTEGGPSGSTTFYVYYLFQRAFTFLNMGYASAMAWLLFILILVLTMLQMRMGRRWVHYG